MQDYYREMPTIVISIPNALGTENKRFERTIASFQRTLQEQGVSVELHTHGGTEFCV